jgi:hypothetical protein
MPEKICNICVSYVAFRLVTQDYKPIKTQNELYYIGDNRTEYNVRQVDAPNPIWSDANGNSVTQYGAVELGGMFGLNS